MFEFAISDNSGICASFGLSYVIMEICARKI
jgi:hypothetical protein